MKSQKPTAIKPDMLKQRGITLIETMATLAILAILTSVALPSFNEMIKNNRISNQANTIISSLHYARGETITRGVSVRVEPNIAGTDWSNGWLIRIDGNNDADFSDHDGDGDFDDGDIDRVIRTYDGVQNSTLTSSQATIVFNPGGDLDSLSAPTLTLRANDCTDQHQRIINIALSGLVALDSNRSC